MERVFIIFTLRSYSRNLRNETRSALSNKRVSSSEFLQEIYNENMVFDPKSYSRYNFFRFLIKKPLELTDFALQFIIMHYELNLLLLYMNYSFAMYLFFNES